MADLGVLTPVRPEVPEGVQQSRYLGELKPAEPGEHYTNPINEQHPDLATLFSGRSRALLKFFADAGPKTMRRALEDAGFEARHRGGMAFSLRKPGGEWYVMDPGGWRNLDPREMVKDITDVAGWVPTGVGMGVGGIGGAAVTPTVPFVGAIPGAGGGAAAVEAGKQTLAELLGYSPNLDEAAGKVLEEGFYGATGELLGRAGKAFAGTKTGDELIRAAGLGARRLKGGVVSPVSKLRRGLQRIEDAEILSREATPSDVLNVQDVFSREAVERKIDEGYGKLKDVSREDVRRIEKELAKVDPHSVEAGGIAERLQAFREAEEATRVATATKKSAERRVTKAKRDLQKAKGKVDEWSKRAKTEKTAKARRFRDQWKTKAKSAREELKEAEASLDDVLTQPEPRDVSRRQYVNSIAKSRGIEITGKSEARVVDELTDTLNQNFDAGLRRVAESLEIKNWATRPIGEIRLEVIKNSPGAKKIIERQVRETLDTLGPQEPFYVEWLRRTAKPEAGKKVGQLDRRTFQKLPSRDERLFRQVDKELEGKTLLDAQRRLLRAGWTGDLDDIKSVPDAKNALYWFRRAGVKGKGMLYDPREYDLYGAATGATPSGKKYAGSLIDVTQPEESVRRGEAWRHFGVPEVTRLEIGGQRIPLGGERIGVEALRRRGVPEAYIQSSLRGKGPIHLGLTGRHEIDRLLKQADVLRRAKKVVGKPIERVGAALETPLRAGRKALESTAEAVTGRRGLFGEREALRGAKKDAITKLHDLAEQLEPFKAVDAKVGRATEEASDLLSRRFLRNAEVNKVRRSLLAAYERIPKSDFPEDIVKLNAAVKAVRDLPEADIARLFGVSPTVVGAGAATYAGYGSTAAGVFGLGLAGKGIRKIGLEIMRDGSGRRLLEFVERATKVGNEKVAQALRIPLRALETRGLQAYKASIFTMMHRPEVRAFFRSEIGESEEG